MPPEDGSRSVQMSEDGKRASQDGTGDLASYWKEKWQQSYDLHRESEARLAESEAEVIVLKHQLALARQELDHCRKAHFSDLPSSSSRNRPSLEPDPVIAVLSSKPPASEQWKQAWRSLHGGLLDYLSKGVITSDLAVPLPLASVPGDLFDVETAKQLFRDSTGSELAFFLGNVGISFQNAVRDFVRPAEAIIKDNVFDGIAKRIAFGRASVRYVSGPIHDIPATASSSILLTSTQLTPALHAQASRRWNQTNSEAASDSALQYLISTVRLGGKIMVFSVDRPESRVILYTSVEEPLGDNLVEELLENLPCIADDTGKNWSFSSSPLYSITRDLHTAAASAIIALRVIHLLVEQASPTRLTPSRLAEASGLQPSAGPPVIDRPTLDRLQNVLVLMVYQDVKRLTSLAASFQRQ